MNIDELINRVKQTGNVELLIEYLNHNLVTPELADFIRKYVSLGLKRESDNAAPKRKRRNNILKRDVCKMVLAIARGIVSTDKTDIWARVVKDLPEYENNPPETKGEITEAAKRYVQKKSRLTRSQLDEIINPRAARPIKLGDNTKSSIVFVPHKPKKLRQRKTREN